MPSGMPNRRPSASPPNDPPGIARAVAAPNSSSAVASLSRLSPCSTNRLRRGRLLPDSTALAAAASGGATIAPSASAAAVGMPATHVPASVTAPAVNNTATTASAVSGITLRHSPRGELSNPTWSSAGAMNNASAMCGSMATVGRPGIKAMAAPASASSDG